MLTAINRNRIIAIIQLPIFIYGFLVLIDKTELLSLSPSVLRIFKFAACVSLVINLMCFLYYLLNPSCPRKVEKKSWIGKKGFVLFLTVFLAILASVTFVLGDFNDGIILLFGVILGLVFIFKGELPEWYINFTQKYNFRKLDLEEIRMTPFSFSEP